MMMKKTATEERNEWEKKRISAAVWELSLPLPGEGGGAGTGKMQTVYYA